MPLSELNRSSARSRGGVKRVELVPASRYAGRASAGAAGWAFVEDRARYTQSALPEGGPVVLVRHTLAMKLPDNPDTRRSIADLLAVAAAEGVVALVTLASGRLLTAGYSVRFGTAYPLRVTGLESNTGAVPADLPTITLTLESIDADPAIIE